MSRRRDQPNAAETLSTLTVNLTFTVWKWRTELALLLTFLGVYALLARTLGTAGTVLWLLLLAVMFIGPNQIRGHRITGPRGWLLDRLYAARVRRHWARAVHRGGAADPHPRRSNRPDPILGPRATRVTRVAAGDLLQIRIGRGSSISRLEQCQGDIENEIRAPIEIRRDARNPSRATVLIRRCDPFEEASSSPWPPLIDGLDALTVWEPVTIGADEDGVPVTHRIVGGHVLVGGITGGGKSVFLRPLLATAALSTDPCALWLFDAKLTELAPWAPAAEEMVGRDGKRALKVLKHLQGIADERQREIVATGADKIRRRDGLPVHVIVVDELANFAELDEGKDIMKALRDLASRGRALGISVIAATQVPHSDIIDTTLRNQFSTRVAFRCADRHHAGTILGQSELAAAAAGISDRTPGVGYALGETGRYVRFRSVFVGRPDDDAPGRRDDVLAVVSLASARRVDVELGGQGSGQIPLLRKGERDPHPRPQVDPPAVSKLEETEAMLAEHLNGEPLSRKELARRLGRSPDDATVRRALARMLEDGRAVRTDAGWTRPEPPASD